MDTISSIKPLTVVYVESFVELFSFLYKAELTKDTGLDSHWPQAGPLKLFLPGIESPEESPLVALGLSGISM